MKTIYRLLFIKQFARYPSLYVLGAFPVWLKVLSRDFGAVLLKKAKNVRDSAPLKFFRHGQEGTVERHIIWKGKQRS